jgi:hypothetical protein
MRVHFKRVFAVGYYNAAVTDAERVVVDIDNCLPRKEWAIPPLVTVNASARSIEMLLMSKKARTVLQWRSLLKDRVRGVCVQTCDTLSRHAIDGVERMLTNVCARDCVPVRNMDRFMDAYRLLSGGLKHFMDARDWMMTKRALRRVQERLGAADAAMNAYYTEYYQRVWRLRDDEVCRDELALSLLDNACDHARKGGALYTVLQRHLQA